ncbi:MAG: hypothetical protein COB04_05735 [Gammaproteobacteria bacterium]|nr:MAG: hypothetical protein COB04_05735 [Gammaproteobacteria bacterium]
MTDDGIYQAPDSNPVTSSVPESFYSGALSASALNRAGWLSIFYALLTIPMILLPFSGEIIGQDLSEKAAHGMSVLSLAVWAYIFLMFNRFVTLRFNLTSLKIYIMLLVGLSIVLLILSFFLDQSEDVESLSPVSVVYFALLVPYGVVSILFGRKLLSVAEPYPYLKGLAWAMIISGVCMASVVFFLVALLIGLVADVFFALIFFRGKQELIDAASD